MTHPSFLPKQLESSKKTQTLELFLFQAFRPPDGNLFLNNRRYLILPLLNRRSISSINDILYKGCSTQLIPRKSRNITIFMKQILKILLSHHHSKYYSTNQETLNNILAVADHLKNYVEHPKKGNFCQSQMLLNHYQHAQNLLI